MHARARSIPPGFRAAACRALLALLLIAAACGRLPAPSRLLVLVSVPPQADLVQRLLGDLGDVEVLVPPGSNPHTHEPTVRQMKAVSRAAVYLTVGHPRFPFEAVWLETLCAENPDLSVVDGSAGLLLDEEDPHVWLAPQGARNMAAGLAAALVALRPEHSQQIARRRDELLAHVDAVDASVRARLAPFAGRRFFVFHPAWGYFAAAYGLQQLSVEHGHREPSPRELMEVLERAAADGTRVLFATPQVSREGAEVVAAQIGAEVVVVDPLGHDWGANLLELAEALAAAWGAS